MNGNNKKHQRKAPNQEVDTGRNLSTREMDQLRGLNVREFALAVGLGVTRCYAEIKLGRINVLKAGSRTIIPTTEIEAFFQRLAADQTAQKGGR